jgi:hypothetical protein
MARLGHASEKSLLAYSWQGPLADQRPTFNLAGL